jgi:uncharacterized membrane protein
LSLEDASLKAEIETPEDAPEELEAKAEAVDDLAEEAMAEAEVTADVKEDSVEDVLPVPDSKDLLPAPQEPDIELPPPAPPAYPAPARTTAGAAPTSGLAIASLALAVGGLTILPLLGSIVAIILGYMARKEIRRRPGELSGDGIATAGIVLGWIAVAVSVLGLLLVGGLGICGICGAMGSGG